MVPERHIQGEIPTMVPGRVYTGLYALPVHPVGRRTYPAVYTRPRTVVHTRIIHPCDDVIPGLLKKRGMPGRGFCFFPLRINRP